MSSICVSTPLLVQQRLWYSLPNVCGFHRQKTSRAGEHAMSDRHAFIKTKGPSRDKHRTKCLFHISILLQTSKIWSQNTGNSLSVECSCQVILSNLCFDIHRENFLGIGFFFLSNSWFNHQLFLENPVTVTMSSQRPIYWRDLSSIKGGLSSSVSTQCSQSFLDDDIYKDLPGKEFQKDLKKRFVLWLPSIWKFGIYINSTSDVTSIHAITSPYLPYNQVCTIWLLVWKRSIFRSWLIVIIYLKPLVPNKLNIFDLVPRWKTSELMLYLISAFHVLSAADVFTADGKNSSENQLEGLVG